MSSPKDSTSTFWHVPGPSSKYHKREYSRPKHQPRFSSPDADLARSHIFNSPHHSRNNSPFSHFTSLVRSHTAPMERQDPLTPLRDSTIQIPHDSPFSDYFTDEARSVSKTGAYDMTPPEVQRVLLRLNNLGAHMLRQKPSQNNFDSISEQLDELERSLVGMELSPRNRRTMSDSGFVDDDHFSQQATSPRMNGERHDTFTPLPTDVRTKVPLEEEDEHVHQVNRERILAEATSILERVSKANVDLRQRFEEMRELNDQHAYQVEESTREALSLRSENESLKSAIAFDHSELLFLKLQLKALEVQAGGEHEEETEQEREKRVTLDGGIDEWKSDWDDVDARQRGRRIKHRVTSSTPSDFVRHREDGRSPDEEGDWKLDLCKKRQGRVQSITIRRFSSSLGLDGAGDDREVEGQEPEEMGEAPATPQSTNGSTEDKDTPSSMDMAENSHGCQADIQPTTPAQQHSGLIVLFEQDCVAPSESDHSTVKTIFEEGSEASDISSKQHEREDENAARKQQDHEDEAAHRKKSAWAEFMNSLTEFAGMTDR
ncbi:hypothetical protein KVT40_005018 [Elsinoe batatas]|uniref:Rhodanese domain-containing protein n=1 Tax=Elsinoe batatas TaxID=2601811 RepID=A0A8K0L4X9_9PEZI|nr:hypothetical protein KVT40_005018 [Elsinoe batatas]